MSLAISLFQRKVRNCSFRLTLTNPKSATLCNSIMAIIYSKYRSRVEEKFGCEFLIYPRSNSPQLAKFLAFVVDTPQLAAGVVNSPGPKYFKTFRPCLKMVFVDFLKKKGNGLTPFWKFSLIYKLYKLLLV